MLEILRKSTALPPLAALIGLGLMAWANSERQHFVQERTASTRIALAIELEDWVQSANAGQTGEHGDVARRAPLGGRAHAVP